MNIRNVLAGLTLLNMSWVATAQEFTIEWFTMDSGGTLVMGHEEWELDGTLGQWDAHLEPAIADDWSLQGGFWLWGEHELLDVLFRDRFES